MNQLYQQLIELVKCSLNQTKFPEPVTQELFIVAVENGISGTVFKALDKTLVDEEIYKLFREEYYQYIKKDEKQQALLNELRDIFNKAEIDFIFLKGSFIKELYPEKYMRSMGDIDVLVKAEKLIEVEKILKENNFRKWTQSDNHDCYLKYDDLNIEIHPKLCSELYPEYQDIFKNPWESSEKTTTYEWKFNVEYNFFYQIYHMLKHIYSSGAGFRTIIDLYLILKANETKLDLKRFDEHMSNFYNSNFAKNIIFYINVIFSKKLLYQLFDCDNIFPVNIDEFTKYLFVSGTHGVGRKHNNFAGGIAKSNEKSRNLFFGKIRFVIYRTFLPYNQMKVMYPFIKNRRMLLPLAWIIRIFKLIFSKKASTKQRINYLKITGKEVHDVENLFKQMGL